MDCFSMISKKLINFRECYFDDWSISPNYENRDDKSICRYKTKKSLQDKGIHSNLLHSTTSSNSSSLSTARRIPVQMLVCDGKPCPSEFIGACQTHNTIQNSFACNGTYFSHTATFPSSTQYYMHNGWSW